MNRTSCLVTTIVAPNVINLRRYELPPLGDSEVLIRVSFCGICGSDLLVLAGLRHRELPYTPGHEYTGVVEALGCSVRTLNPGDAVVVDPNYVCNDCYFCRGGQFNLCTSSDRRLSSSGGLSEYVIVDSKQVLRLPDSIGVLPGVLLEPLACCVHVLSHIGATHRRLVVITGIGTMGMLVLKMVTESKLADVIVASEPIERKRRCALENGATTVVDPTATRLGEVVRKITPHGADLIIECSGSLQAVKESLPSIRRGGEVILVGRTADDATWDVSPAVLARNEISIRGTSRYNPIDMEYAVRHLATAQTSLQNCLGQIFPLVSVEEAFRHATRGDSIKTIVACS